MPHIDEKTLALAKLQKRKEKNQQIKQINNGDLPAGADMFFYCDSCGGEIRVPELYLKRDRLCTLCKPLKAAGWIV